MYNHNYIDNTDVYLFPCSETDNCVFQGDKASTISNPTDPKQKSKEPQQLKNTVNKLLRRLTGRRKRQKVNIESSEYINDNLESMTTGNDVSILPFPRVTR